MWHFVFVVFAMIVQRIRSTVNEREQKQLLMDLDVVMRSNECPHIVKFYGALFKEVRLCLCHDLYSLASEYASQHVLIWSQVQK